MQDIFRRITAFMLDQYATVLIVLGVVSGITYLVLIYDIQGQEGNSTRVKLSAEQGQIVHDINFLLSKKTYVKNEDQLHKKIMAKSLSSLLFLLMSTHLLVKGSV